MSYAAALGKIEKPNPLPVKPGKNCLSSKKQQNEARRLCKCAGGSYQSIEGLGEEIKWIDSPAPSQPQNCGPSSVKLPQGEVCKLASLPLCSAIEATNDRLQKEYADRKRTEAEAKAKREAALHAEDPFVAESKRKNAMLIGGAVLVLALGGILVYRVTKKRG